MVFEECRGRWRVALDPDVERFFESRGLQGSCGGRGGSLRRASTVTRGLL